MGKVKGCAPHFCLRKRKEGKVETMAMTASQRAGGSHVLKATNDEAIVVVEFMELLNQRCSPTNNHKVTRLMVGQEHRNPKRQIISETEKQAIHPRFHKTPSAHDRRAKRRRPTSIPSASPLEDSDEDTLARKKSKPVSERKRIRAKNRICQHSNCNTPSRSRGLCRRHGGGPRCSTKGCETSAEPGGFCCKHGGGRRCNSDGCEKHARRGGLCKRHFAEQRSSLILDNGCLATGFGQSCTD